MKNLFYNFRLDRFIIEVNYENGWVDGLKAVLSIACSNQILTAIKNKNVRKSANVDVNVHVKLLEFCYRNGKKQKRSYELKRNENPVVIVSDK